MWGSDVQEIEATVVDGNGTETGHIIATTIGGRNGQPKQVQHWDGCRDGERRCDDECVEEAGGRGGWQFAVHRG